MPRGSAYRPYWDNGLASQVAQGFYVSFEEKCDLLEDGFLWPAIQMELDAKIPWVLEKDIHDISFDWR